MYKRKGIKKLGRRSSNRKALMLNQIRSLCEAGAIVTTTPKAKVLKGELQSLIASVKNTKNVLVLRRDLQVTLGKETLVKKFLEYAKGDKVGVRTVKVGFRSGDNGEKTRVELMGLKKAKKVVKEEKEISEKEVVEVPKTKGTKNVIEKLGGKSIDKSANIKKVDRATSRSGL